MRITEVRHPGEPWLSYWLGNLTAIDDKYVKSIGIAWLFKEGEKWMFMPRITGRQSLFFNAVFFLRYTIAPPTIIMSLLSVYCHSLWPLLFGVFFSIRWAKIGPVLGGKPRSFLQAGIGYKLNGRFGLLLRMQNDISSASGVTGANVGQAKGFNYGPH